MDHFKAVEKMRAIARANGLTEYSIEIQDGPECEGGRNVTGYFADDEGYVCIFWDAAFQKMTTERLEAV